MTLVAVLGNGSPASLAQDAADAARAGAAVVMARLSAAGRPARLPFELADFDAGVAPTRVPLSRAGIDGLAAAARGDGARLALSIGDAPSLAAAAGVPLAAVHLTAAALVDLPLIAAAASVGPPLWLDTAMASLAEVGEAVAEAVKAGGRVTLLHGLATTPARPDEINLRALVTLRDRFALPVGFEAREPVPVVATAAIALGATVLAVPFGAGGFDATALAALRADIDLVTRALGDGDKRVQASEWAERDRAHASLVARVDIARGRTLTADMLETARPGIGLKPRAASGIVGRRTTVDIPAGTLITLGMIE